MHLLSFRDYWAFSSWSQLPLSNWQLVPTGNPIRAEVNGHFIFHSTELQTGGSEPALAQAPGRTSLRPTQGDSASRSPALPISLSLLRGRRAWPLSRLWAVKWPAKRMGLLSLPFSSGLTRRGRRTSADAIISRGHLAAPPAGALAKQQTPRFASVCALIKRVPQQFCFRLPLVLARRCTLPTESQPATASELGAMDPHRRAIVALFGSHISCFSETQPPATFTPGATDPGRLD